MIDHLTREQLIERVAGLEARLLEREQGWKEGRIDRSRYVHLASKLAQGSVTSRDAPGNYFAPDECSDLLQELNAEYSISSWARWWVQRLTDDYQAVWTMLQAPDIKEALRADWERQREQIRELKRQITIARENNAQRNRELDALHYVWCDGTCSTGANRYGEDGPDGITQEIVDAAVRNTERLKRWWANRQRRLQRDKEQV